MYLIPRVRLRSDPSETLFVCVSTHDDPRPQWPLSGNSRHASAGGAVFVCAHSRAHACVCVFARVCKHLCVPGCVCVCLCACMCLCTCVCVSVNHPVALSDRWLATAAMLVVAQRISEGARSLAYLRARARQGAVESFSGRKPKY